jgi:hypothetical protein
LIFNFFFYKLCFENIFCDKNVLFCFFFRCVERQKFLLPKFQFALITFVFLVIMAFICMYIVNETSRELAFVAAARAVCRDASVSFVLDDYKAQARFLFEPLAECRKIGLTPAYDRAAPVDEGLDLAAVNSTSYVFAAAAARDEFLVPFVELLDAMPEVHNVAIVRSDRASKVHCSSIGDDLTRNGIALLPPRVVQYDASSDGALEAALASVAEHNAAPDALIICTRTSLSAATIRAVRASSLNFKTLHMTPLLDIAEFDDETRDLFNDVSTVVEGGASAITAHADAALFGSARQFADAYEADWREPLPDRLVILGTMLDLMREALRRSNSLQPAELRTAMLTISAQFMSGNVRFSAHGSNIGRSGAIIQVFTLCV